MPKVKDKDIRKDGYIRVRLTHTLKSKIDAIAKHRKMTVSELVRQLLQAELNEAK